MGQCVNGAVMGTAAILINALEPNHLKSMYDYCDPQRHTHRNTPFKEPRTHDDVVKWKHFPRYWPFVRGEFTGPGEFPAQWPVTRSFDVFFDLRLNKRLSKQP